MGGEEPDRINMKSEPKAIEPSLKARPEDFLVEEVASYEPNGKGTHLWMRLGKRGLSTRAAVGRVARLLEVEARRFGYAGQKDARAVTSQWVSLEHPPADALERLEPLRGELSNLGPDVPLVLLAVTWHKNRLGLGHLHGNRFRIRLRGLEPGVAERLAGRLEELARTGAPSAFGPQRFGHRGDSGAIGAALLAGRHDEAVERILGRVAPEDTGRIRAARAAFDRGELGAARAAWPRDHALELRLLGKLESGLGTEVALESLDRRDLEFFGSAFQSELFNTVLELRRSTPGGLDILEGELAMRLPIGRKAFRVEDLDLERERRRRLEITPSGPLFGPKMESPTGAALEFECAALAARGLTLDDFDLGLGGARRGLLMRVDEVDSGSGCDAHGDYLELAFMLAKGCYATSLIEALWYPSAP
jgi:tRNA pseudouridine13 synthase